jgi:citrate synthase
MPTVVRDLMSTPVVTCEAGTSLAEAAHTMRDAGIGSVIVTDRGKVAGILTERDLLRAAAAATTASAETVELWMTANPDVLGPEEEVDAAWTSLAHHQYRHLPVVDGHELVGVVSLRDLMGVARLRPADEQGTELPAGLEGVVAAETALGDVRGEEGFFHYRQYSAVDLAARRSLEDVWYLLLEGELPDRHQARRFATEVAELRSLPPGLAAMLPAMAGNGRPLEVLRSAVSLLGAELGWRPTLDIDGAELRAQTLRLCSVVPTIMAAAHNLGEGRPPVAPRSDLSTSANYLWMVTGSEPTARHARAVEQYQILTIDHGFNASTFTARVITSTGADLAAAVCGAIGALSGPLHGGAPSRALAMLDEIGSEERAEEWLRAAVDRGDRVMGFGHRVYKTDDPRSLFLRDVARSLGGPLVDLAAQVERSAVDVLAEMKPGRRLFTNVEFYAGVVMHTCGLPREMFTPTFAAGRAIGWSAHVIEQAAHNRLIRPSARYTGPPPPVPVPDP